MFLIIALTCIIYHSAAADTQEVQESQQYYRISMVSTYPTCKVTN